MQDQKKVQEQDPYPVQPIVSILFSDSDDLTSVRSELEEQWGTVAYRSEPITFDVTDYYEDEMGADLEKCIWSLESEMDAGRLVEWKKICVEVERRFSDDGNRRVNLDPGYIDPSKLVLASLKENGQKIYLQDGIFADIILFYEKGDWEPLPWTFPDFRAGLFDEALTRIRTDWKRKRSN